MEGVELTSRAFGDTFAFFPYILALAVCLFAFSSMIAWSYYGLKSFTYLFGETPQAEISFKVIYCLITIVGGAAQMDNIINFMDAALFAMAVPNIIGLYIMAPMLKRDVKAYLATIKNI
jgi:AGCS family alanine or glycine:cation symporter